MQFRILGPLEVLDDDRPVGLGGTKRRATLGYLLIRANRVVAISDLLRALWPDDEAPSSARKILQNAVWGLRRALAPRTGTGPSASLRTQSPGYRLSVDPDAIDLHRFRTLVARGRESLAAADPTAAARELRQALELWRGPALADLVEAGIAWPELAAIQSGRLDVMEDLFDAELARGHHHAVLGELERMVEATGVRERAHAQLMIALYRSGRQADALNVYSRVRSVLVDELGLEPGRELQTLQQAILAQDPALNFPGEAGWRADQRGSPAAFEAASGVRATAPTAMPASAAAGHAHQFYPDSPASTDSAGLIPAGMPAVRTVAGGDTGPLATGPKANGVFTTRPAVIMPARQRQVSVLLVRTQLDVESLDGDPRAVDEFLADISRWIHGVIKRFGGTVTASIGSVSMAVFGAGRESGEQAERAVLAALAVREGLTSSALSPTAPPRAGRALSLYAAVATGAALVRYRLDNTEQPLSITGKLLTTSDCLLGQARAGEIRTCEITRAQTQDVINYAAPEPPGEVEDGWTAQDRRHTHDQQSVVPTREREFELALLTGVLEWSRHQTTPRLVAVLGGAGAGKTQLLTEFGRQAAARSHVVEFSVGRIPGPGEDQTRALQRSILTGLCDVWRAGAPVHTSDELINLIGRLTDDAELLNHLLRDLHPAGDGELLTEPDGPVGRAGKSAVWGRFLRLAARERPVVLLIDDVHLADHALFAFVASLTDLTGVALFVVTSARPDLSQQDPARGDTESHGATLTLKPPSGATDNRLLDVRRDFVPCPGDAEAKSPAGSSRRTLQVDRADRGDDRRRSIYSLPLQQFHRDGRLRDHRVTAPATPRAAFPPWVPGRKEADTPAPLFGAPPARAAGETRPSPP